eukprot:TRINITY_DN4494_c0_g1_i1.p1 TRINITY_DN4494_c0_g1~~TRINITY_DN4494_c0_g1_i1.p1  ORF type:complete len:406 (-),score=62.66 TRINITY_DN4494_c0_g1_i1:33-1208(-)
MANNGQMPSIVLLGMIAMMVMMMVKEVTAMNKSTRVVVNGNDGKFLWGLNYPWRKLGHDFSSNTMGVSSQFSTINHDWSDMSTYKTAKIARWWLFPFGDGINWDSNGYATGLADGVIDNINAAIKIAEENNIYLIFTFFSYQISCPTNQGGGGHGNIFTDDNAANSVAWQVIAPLIHAYANVTRIYTWEIINEPEHIIIDLPDGSNSICSGSPTTIHGLYRFVRKLADVIHQYSDQYVTVGSSSLRYYRLYTPAFAQQWADYKGYTDMPQDMGLDWYQSHHYVWENNDVWQNNKWFGPASTVSWSPEKQNYNDLPDVDKPIVIGEVECKSDGTNSCQQRLDAMFNNGYAGILPWSYNGDNCACCGCDGYDVNYDQTTQWYYARSSDPMFSY